jgi:F-type H+-transporting ATPase subunit b
MMRRVAKFWLAAVLLAAMAASGQQPAPAQQPAASSSNSQQTTNSNASSPSQELARQSNAAEKGEDETAAFKHSPVVRWIASKLGISAQAEYWVLYGIDFAIIAFLIAWAWKKNVPAAFRTRTATIRKTMDEAQAASADANRRLGDIEARLARLDQEIAKMAAAADTEAAAEEARIRAAADQDSQRIVAGAQAEIESSARIALRELKAHAADLAISLAEKRIQVDAATDHQLVQNFSRELGGSNGSGAR